MSSGTSSTASPSPSISPKGSTDDLPTLPRLVVHFVSSKRALTTTSSHVWRADELVTGSRALIEEIALLNARNAFASRSISEQVDTLQAIREDIADVGARAEDELRAQMSTLDVATKRLEETLHIIRTTAIDSSLRDQTPMTTDETHEKSPTTSEDDEAEQRTLFDFIDEAKHEDILDALRKLIDSFFQDAHAGLADTVKSFDSSLTNISTTISQNGHEEPQHPPTNLVDQLSITQLYRGLENHAAEAAKLLHSLVSHYDLCVTALKHTEGGGEAARAAMAAEDLTKTNDASVEESLYHRSTAEPISRDEHRDMLAVLETDSHHVDDAVIEIHDRMTAMEQQYTKLIDHTQRARDQHRRLHAGVVQLDAMRAQLPPYMASSRTFREMWAEIRANIRLQTTALDEMTEFYESFLTGYKKLLKEVVRRRSHAERAKAVAVRANRELERLWEADQDARQRFFAEVGSHLPQDLYPDFQADGVRWVMTAMGDEDAEQAD